MLPGFPAFEKTVGKTVLRAESSSDQAVFIVDQDFSIVDLSPFISY